MAGGDESKYIDDPPKLLLKTDHILHKLLPIVLVVLFGYLFIYFAPGIYHPWLSIIEYVILFYFVSEVGVIFALYENKWQFLKDKWINVVLILPFLAVFRTLGRVGQIANLLRSIEGIQFAMAAEVPVLSRAIQQLPKLQKLGHGIVDLPKVLKKLKLKKSLASPLVLITLISTGITLVLNRLQTNHSDEEE